MMDAIGATVELEGLVEAAERRTVAFAAEREALAELVDLAERMNLPSQLIQLRDQATEVGTFCDALDQEFSALAVRATIAVDALAGQAERLHTVISGDMLNEWNADAEELEATVGASLEQVQAHLKPLAETVGEVASTRIMSAATDLIEGIDALAQMCADRPSNLEAAREALETNARSALNTLANSIETGCGALEREALETAAQIVEAKRIYIGDLDASMLRLEASLESAARSLEAIGAGIETARSTLSEATQEATRPIGDAVAILEELLQRFRQI